MCQPTGLKLHSQHISHQHRCCAFWFTDSCKGDDRAPVCKAGRIWSHSDDGTVKEELDGDDTASVVEGVQGLATGKVKICKLCQAKSADRSPLMLGIGIQAKRG